MIFQLGTDGTKVELLERCKSLWEKNQNASLAPAQPPKAIFFDMDATLVKQESIDALAAAHGCEAEVSRMTDLAMNGQISFKEALVQRVGLLRGLSEAKVDAVVQLLTPQPGLEAFLEVCHAQGIPLFIASGGFIPIVGKFAKKWGFRAFLANELEAQNGALTGRVSGAIVDGAAKAAWVRATLAREGLAKELCVAIGDGANDRWMMGEVGFGLGFHPKRALWDSIQGACFDGSYGFFQRVLFFS